MNRGSRSLWWVTIGALFASTPQFAVVSAKSQDERHIQNTLLALRSADLRLHGLHYRLTTANAGLCTATVASIGVVLHARSSYLGKYEHAAAALFDFRDAIAVEGVIAGSPAARAGLDGSESIAAIGAIRMPETASVDQVLDAIERDGADGSVRMEISAASGTRIIDIATQQACPERIEVQVSSNDNAGTDGRSIQVTSELMNRVANDDELAAVIAHELAHAILDHPDRLTAAGVSRGLLGEFGRSRRLLERTEQEADLLSVYLLANAGFDPAAAARFWRGAGRRVGGGLLGSGSHQSWRVRAARVEAEAAKILATPERPIIPDLLATRDAALK